jgi:nucleoside-triphosphatase THEP1
MPDKLVILVTGGVGIGKSRLLFHLHEAIRKRWRACGFISFGQGRVPGSKEPADNYRLAMVGRRKSMPWAVRRKDGSGFEFDQQTREKAEAAVRSDFDGRNPEICFLDEIGRLEMNGSGFAELFRFVLESPCKIVVVAVKKNALEEVTSAFAIDAPVVVDLDTTDADSAMREMRSQISRRDDERIGAFAGVGGLVEVGLGSILHAYRVPLKGQALAYLQNLLLVAFGNQLGGRGLVRISFITAMLKAFSPMGNPLRPMAYIFLQGCAFSLPVHLIGWNLFAILLGSVLMAWMTLAVSLAVDYLIFGQSIFAAFSGVITTLSGWLGIGILSLFEVLVGIFILKAVLACGVGCLAYFGDMQPLIRRLGRPRTDRSVIKQSATHLDRKRESFFRATRVAIIDILRPKFIIAFFASILIMLFFANLSTGDLLVVTVRGLCVSYVSFLALRRIDVLKVARWVDRKGGLGLSRSLPTALGVLARNRKDADKSRSDATIAGVSSPTGSEHSDALQRIIPDR